MVAAISVDAVSKTYPAKRGGGNLVTALRDVSLTIEPGEFFGLLGPNGAGKTSLISILAGLSRPTAGRVCVMGHDVVTDFRASRRALGMVPQELVFDPFFTVRECLQMQSGYYGLRQNNAWIDEIISELGLADKADTNMRALSGGMKRRVLVAQALVHKPPVIVLDEPTAGVDVELRQTLWKFIQRLNRAGHTILLTTHYLEEAEQLCGRVAMLKQGRIVALDQTQALLKRVAGVQLHLRWQGAALPEILRAKQIQTNQENASNNTLLRLNDYAEVEHCLSLCRQAGLHIEHLEVRHADLEDVFLQIMTETSVGAAQ